MAETFAARLKQANLQSKTDFNNKLITFNSKITSNKIKYLEIQEKLNSLTRKDSDFFLDRTYFTSNDGSQNTFVYQPALDNLELKEDKSTDCVLSQKPKEVYNSKLKSLYTAFLHIIRLSEYRMGIKLIKILYLQNKTITQAKLQRFILPMIQMLGQEILLTISNLRTVNLRAYCTIEFQ